MNILHTYLPMNGTGRSETSAHCNGSHRLFKCDTFLKIQAKQCFNHAKQSGLCFNCLQPFTRNHTCSKQVCRQCHKRHHTLLRIDRQNQPHDKRSTNNGPPADVKCNSAADVNTYCSFKGQTHGSYSTCNSHCGSSE